MASVESQGNVVTHVNSLTPAVKVSSSQSSQKEPQNNCCCANWEEYLCWFFAYCVCDL